MPNQKQRRRPRVQPEPPRPQMASIVDCFVREMAAILRSPRRSPSAAEQHLKNAAIELLEAMRACLDEGINWLREEKNPELKRIRVEE